jgi:hypothetical protein
LQIVPKRKDKYLLRGQIWVDASTFRIRRIEGVPAKSPSIWIKGIHITLQFAQMSGNVFRRHRYSPLLRAVHTCWPQYPIPSQSLKSAAVSKTDQPKLIIFQHNWLNCTFRTRRFYVRLRFSGNNCRSSVDCLFRARYMNPNLWVTGMYNNNCSDTQAR